MFDEYFSKANELNSQGIPFATAVVVRAEKPTSAKPGDKAIVTVDGVMHGWIGGSCAQPTVIKEAKQAIGDGGSRLIRLSVDPTMVEPREGLVDLPMTCFSGGTLEIFIEPQRPLPHLMVIGNLPVAQALVTVGKAMSYRVTAVDPDTHGAGLESADRVVTQLTDIPQTLTPQTFVVVATHGNFDEAALDMVLRYPIPYVGLVASQKRLEAVNDYLGMQGLGEKETERLKCPAGLNIHAKRGDEIALSIMAEIVQKRQENPEIDVDAFF
ncbi:MAG: XdhC family protein [Chloroflexota bacterium]